MLGKTTCYLDCSPDDVEENMDSAFGFVVAIWFQFVYSGVRSVVFVPALFSGRNACGAYPVPRLF